MGDRSVSSNLPATTTPSTPSPPEGSNAPWHDRAASGWPSEAKKETTQATGDATRASFGAKRSLGSSVFFFRNQIAPLTSADRGVLGWGLPASLALAGEGNALCAFVLEAASLSNAEACAISNYPLGSAHERRGP